MLTIFLSERDEAIFLYEKLLIQSITLDKRTSVKLINDTQIYIQCRKNRQMYVQKIIIPLFIDLLICLKEKKIINQMLEQYFFYTDADERFQICQLATFIMKEGHQNLNSNCTNERSVILKLLQNFFKDIPPTFSLDAFLQFRAKSYINFMHSVTECAIDEYKLEMEYQKYINDVRSDVDKRNVDELVIHVYLGKEYYIFDDNLNILHTFKEKENILKNMIDLIPKQIFLYTNYIDDSFTNKILNIFQERVQIFKTEDFVGSFV